MEQKKRNALNLHLFPNQPPILTVFRKTLRLPLRSKGLSGSKKKRLPAASIALAVIILLNLSWLMGDGKPTTLFVTSTPTLSPTPELGIGSTMLSEKDGMVVVYVPAGQFEMGSENGGSDEEPIHTIYLDSFWIDQAEVTNEMYAKCVKAANILIHKVVRFFSLISGLLVLQEKIYLAELRLIWPQNKFEATR